MPNQFERAAARNMSEHGSIADADAAIPSREISARFPAGDPAARPRH